MRSVASVLLVLAVVVLSFSSPIAALPQEQNSFTPQQRAFGDAIQALTYEEIDQILLETQKYQIQNPGASEESLDRLTIHLVLQQVRKPAPHFEEKSYYPLPQTVFGLSYLEWSLCAMSPSKCVKMYNCSKKAQTTAPNYFSGCTNGKCDAFRHTYWNALMVRNIDYNFARTFAASHEAGIQSNIGSLAFQMDVFNNSWGQSIGQNYPTSRYTDYNVEQTVKSYVTTGKLVIIKNDKIVRSNQ